jgi:class 3 adenylate cyclase
MPPINAPDGRASGHIDRLAKLIDERLEPGADKAKIDERIWKLFGTEWTVMFTDLVGFSRRAAEFGIIHFLQTIFESRRIFAPCIDRWDGILVKTEGDSMLITFPSPRAALECAIDMQRAAQRYNEDRVEEEQVLPCLGIGCGRVLSIGCEDVFGPEVNAAAKLGEDTARAWEILVTDSVAKQVEDMESIGLERIDYVPHGARAAFRVRYEI